MQWSKLSQETIPTNRMTDGRSAAAESMQPPPMWADGGPQRSSDLTSYLEIPFMYKRLIALCALIAALLGWGAILVWPRSYESQAKLVVRVGRESVSLDPSATTSATLMLQKTQEEEVISALEILGSRQVAETVATKLGDAAIINGVLPSADGASPLVKENPIVSLAKTAANWLGSVLLSAGIKDDISDHELAVIRLQSTVSIYSPKKSTVIAVEATSKTPEMAQAIVTCITETFLEEHLKASRTNGSYLFFERQTSEAQSKLNELIDARTKFMQERELVSIEAGRELLQQRRTGLDRDLVVAAGELEQAMSEIKDLEDKVSRTVDEIIASKLEASDATWSGMRQQIYELELAEQSLAANHADTHPKLKQIRTQLVGAREILAKLDSERVDESTTPNPVKIALHQELQRQQTRVAGLTSMIEMKTAQVDEMQKQINKLHEDERELTQIDRDVRVMESTLQMMREKLEEARVIQGLQEEKISNIHVFQPATFVERASSPNKKVLASGFMFFGLLSGFALCLIRQGSSTTLRTKEDVENALNCPVVSNIPLLSRMSSPRLKEQNLYRKKCQALATEIVSFQHLSNQSRGRSLGIIGIDSGAGASMLAANLAVACGVDCHLKTVLVDADARQRSVSRLFGLNGAPGLVELVGGDASHDECLQRAKNAPIGLISSAADTCQDFLTANASEITQSLQAYLEDCDLLIVDLPDASQPDKAVAMAQYLDCMLVVVESEKTISVSAERLIRRLRESDTRIVGVVLNKTRNYLPGWVRRFIAPQV